MAIMPRRTELPAIPLHLVFDFATFSTVDFPLQITALAILGRGAGTLPLLACARNYAAFGSLRSDGKHQLVN